MILRWCEWENRNKHPQWMQWWWPNNSCHSQDWHSVAGIIKWILLKESTWNQNKFQHSEVPTAACSVISFISNSCFWFLWWWHYISHQVVLPTTQMWSSSGASITKLSNQRVLQPMTQVIQSGNMTRGWCPQSSEDSCKWMFTLFFGPGMSLY